MVSSLKKVLMKKPQSFMSKVNLNKWNYGSLLNQNKLEENYREFHEIIKNSGAEILELSIDNSKREMCDSIFTHDPSLVINDGAVILKMGKKLRIKETEQHENFYKSINIPIIGKITNEGTVEGGDCLWINDKILLVGESYRTNLSGINQLTNILKSHDIKIIPIKLPKYSESNSCFHLMSLISLLDNDLAIGCLSLMPSKLIKILKKYNIQLLEIPEEDYFNSKTLAVNILALSPRNLVLMNGYPKIYDLLSKNKCNLHLFSGNELCIKTEGGPTCLTRAIWRN